MSVAVGTKLTGLLANTWSLGPIKIQVFNVALISGDVSVTLTADRMATVLFAFMAPGVTQTAAPTYSTNVATFTITDPAASVYCQAFVFGI